MTDTITLAHLTDAHLTLHDPLRARDLLGKRAFSALNWRYRRRRVHMPAVASLIVNDMAQFAPDHIAMTGDAVNFGLPGEFRRAAAWLGELGAETDVSFVPGNHEAIHRGVETEMIEAFGRFATGDDGVVGFPYLRRRGVAAIIGVSSCITTRLGRAQGQVGAGQLARLEDILQQARGMCRVVLIHHPPAGPCKPRKDLLDRDAFAAVIGRAGAELVLHGHNHLAQESVLQGPTGPVPVIGAPSASAAGGGHDDPAEWRLLTISREGPGFEIDIRRRRLAATGLIEDAPRLHLSVPGVDVSRSDASARAMSPL